MMPDKIHQTYTNRIFAVFNSARKDWVRERSPLELNELVFYTDRRFQDTGKYGMDRPGRRYPIVGNYYRGTTIVEKFRTSTGLHQQVKQTWGKQHY